MKFPLKFRRSIIVVSILLTMGALALMSSHFIDESDVIYVLRGDTGGLELSTDLMVGESDRLVYMLKIGEAVYTIIPRSAIARHKQGLEVKWDAELGEGIIKQYRKDGTEFSVSFSRYMDTGGRPRGLFIGGDLAYGDPERDSDGNSSGMAYYDGSKWIHLWCSSNEGFSLSGPSMTVGPTEWTYRGSRVLKRTSSRVIVVSQHEREFGGVPVVMTRTVSMNDGDDYLSLTVSYANAGDHPIMYTYSFGDEPWVGKYSEDSRGDLGWHKDGTVEFESSLSPVRTRYAGFWDRGNVAAGESTGSYSGYANFIEWGAPLPSHVYFSNNFEACCTSGRKLADSNNRVLVLAWVNQMLRPGESRDHTVKLGLASVGAGDALPTKPVTD